MKKKLKKRQKKYYAKPETITSVCNKLNKYICEAINKKYTKQVQLICHKT